MRRILEPVEVQTRKGWPVHIRWNRQQIAVQQPLEFWIRESRWWAQAERRVYFRLKTNAGAVELYRCDGLWILVRVFD